MNKYMVSNVNLMAYNMGKYLLNNHGEVFEMKLDRILSILIILLAREQVQAKELAEKFEVSMRTIYRDIDAINQAGIPIVSFQGYRGGIGILEGYKLDNNILTINDMATLVNALKSITSSYKDVNNEILLQKLKSVVPESKLKAFNLKTQQVFIDFSPWGNEEKLKLKIDTLKNAINESKLITCSYRDMKGLITDRRLEPHTIILKGRNWYLYAYCNTRNNFRLFKISRIANLCVLDETFQQRELDLEDLPWDKGWNSPAATIKLVLKFQKDQRALAEEINEGENIKIDEKGCYIIETFYPEDNGLYSYLLGFGDSVEVIEPLHVREKIKNLAVNIKNIYD